MTNCYDEGRLRAYLDGELPPLERAALGAHLADCAICQDQLGRQRGLAVRVRTLLPVPPAALPPVPSVVLVEPPPAVLPPAPIVELDCA